MVPSGAIQRNIAANYAETLACVECLNIHEGSFE